MFKTAEDFFTSLGLYGMTPVFWDQSVINQTAWGKMIVCHASAEDFCLGSEGNDYRYVFGQTTHFFLFFIFLLLEHSCSF